LVWDTDGETEENARRIEADDAEEAATRWARLTDWSSGEASIGFGAAVHVVHVRRVDTGETEPWKVSGEAEPNYRAAPATSAS
jgi:hypothetical protein